MRIYLALLLFTTCTLSVFAQQNDFKTEFYFGAKVGTAFSKVRFYPSIVESFQQGTSGGLMFRLISEPHIGFQVELNYTQKGWREEATKYFRRLEYVEIPFMTHVNLGKKALRFTLGLGPEVAFMIAEKQGFNSTTPLISGDDGYREYYGKPTDSKIDFLFTVGLGIEYHIKGGNALAFEGRAYYSLPNLFDPDTYPYKVSQSNGAQLTLAYLFQINKSSK